MTMTRLSISTFKFLGSTTNQSQELLYETMPENSSIGYICV